jgi:hypothetical protein
MDDIITVDKKQIALMVDKAGKVMFKKDAEEELMKLLKLKDEIDQALDTVKGLILNAGRSITPDFTGVIGKRMKCVVRRYGDRYSTKNPEFIKETVIHRADSDKIDEFVQKNRVLPSDTVENERQDKLTIIVPNEQLKTIGQISD